MSFSRTWYLPILTILFSCGSPSPKGGPPVSRESIRPADSSALAAEISHSPRPYILVNFFATWCKPCRKEMPAILEFHARPDSKVQVILVSLDDDTEVRKDLPAFLGELGVDFPTFYCSKEKDKFVNAFHPDWDGNIPLNLLFSREGRLLDAFGLTSAEEIDMMVTRYETTQRR